MKNKFNYKWLVFLVFLILLISIIYSQDSISESDSLQIGNVEKSLGDLFNKGIDKEDIIVKSLEEKSVVNVINENDRIIFRGDEDFSLKIKNSKGEYDEYSGFKSEKERKNEIILDKNGKVIGADFITKANKKYFFDNYKVDLPSNSHFNLKNKEAKILVPEKSFLSLPEKSTDREKSKEKEITFRYEGDGDVKFYEPKTKKNFFLNDGVLSYNNDKSFVDFRYSVGFAKINNVLIEKSDSYVPKSSEDYKTVLKFDGTKDTGNFVGFGNFLEASGKGYHVKLDKGNQYLNVKENEFKVDLIGDSSFIITEVNGINSIYFNDKSALNGKIINGDIKITNGDTEILESGNKLIKVPVTESSGAVPIEVYSGNDHWLISKYGEVADSSFEAKNLLGQQNIKERVLLGTDGNIKYPYIKFLNDFYSQKISQLSTHSGTYNSFVDIPIDKNEFYIDGSTKKVLFEDIDKNSAILKSFFDSEAKRSITKHLLENFPNDEFLKEKISEILKQPWKYSSNQYIDLGVLDVPDAKGNYVYKDSNNFLNIMDTLESNPNLQIDFLNHATIMKLSLVHIADTNFLNNVIKTISDDSVNEKFMEFFDFGSVASRERFMDKYQLYKGFDSYFPEYSGLADDEKLVFISAGVSNNKATGQTRGFSYDEVKAVLENYYDKQEKNPVIFDNSYSARIYNYDAIKPDEIKEFPDRAKEFAKSFSKSVIYTNEETPQNSILKDISDPSIDKSLFVFNNHGNANVQTLKKGSWFFQIGEITVSDKEVSESLFKRYVDSSSNPSKRNFGNNVIFFESCFSADFIDNVQTDLKSKLSNLGVNPNQVKFPTMISLASQREYGTSPGIFKKVSEEMKNDGKFTMQKFLDMRTNLQKEGNLNSPTLWYNNINNINNCKIGNGEYCRGL